MRVKVSQPALLARINRRLAAKGKKVFASRNHATKQEFGEFYCVSLDSRGVLEKNIDLDEFARRMSALRPWERL